MRKTAQRLFWAGMLGLAAAGAQAAHPLITEDTGIQGKGNFQLELTRDDHRDSEDGVETRSLQYSAILTYGVTDTVDVAVAVTRLRDETTELGLTTTEKGQGDAALFAKWRFYEKEALSLAVKPEITFHTGDPAKGLGSGRHTFALNFMASLENDRFTHHFHAGYLRNNNIVGERKDIFHLSAATVYQATPEAKLVADIGADSNTDLASHTWPAVLVTALIYSPRPDLDLDVGVQWGLNRVATDYAILAGVTVRW